MKFFSHVNWCTVTALERQQEACTLMHAETVLKRELGVPTLMYAVTSLEWQLGVLTLMYVLTAIEKELRSQALMQCTCLSLQTRYHNKETWVSHKTKDMMEEGLTWFVCMYIMPGSSSLWFRCLLSLFYPCWQECTEEIPAGHQIGIHYWTDIIPLLVACCASHEILNCTPNFLIGPCVQNQ